MLLGEDAVTQIIEPRTRYTKQHTAASKGHINPFLFESLRRTATYHMALQAPCLWHSRCYSSSRASDPFHCHGGGRCFCQYVHVRALLYVERVV